jgi:hypothetical protein
MKKAAPAITSEAAKMVERAEGWTIARKIDLFINFPKVFRLHCQ